MARSHGRILATIWSDPDFVALDVGAQRLFLFLLSQPDLGHSGLIALRERRWSSTAAGLSPKQVREQLTALAEHRFLVVDDETEEVFIRSLIRRDEVWRQPNVLAAAVGQISSITSGEIRCALAEELRRIKAENDVSERVRGHIDRGLAELSENGSLNPPPNSSENPSANPSERVPETLSEGYPSTSGVGEGETNTLTSSSEVVTFTSANELADPTPPTTDPPRLDVQRLCDHLADRIAENGSNRPVITGKWRDAARLMLDRDGRTEDQIHSAIDWSQDHEFWRSNILSMPKLRQQYEQLRLQAQRDKRRPQLSETDANVAALLGTGTDGPHLRAIEGGAP